MYREIEGHPNYAVSDNGCVYRILTKGCYSLLVPDFSNGYARVDLDGKKEYVGRLVLETFEPQRELSHKVFYIDGNPNNNRLSNLCWLSPRDIQLYSQYTPEYRQQLLHRARG